MCFVVLTSNDIIAGNGSRWGSKVRGYWSGLKSGTGSGRGIESVVYFDQRLCGWVVGLLYEHFNDHLILSCNRYFDSIIQPVPY